MRVKKNGFTLAELLITIGIIVILAVIIVPIVSGLMNKGQEASEDVNATLYTSIMQRYATDTVEAASKYPRLTVTGGNSEYAVFSGKAGKGTYPGYNIIASNSQADVLDEIRKEANIAIKAYSDTAVTDDYFIMPPSDDGYEYAYYYLTGKVAKVKTSDMRVATVDDLQNGILDVNDYWVYLSRSGGSGAALGGVSEGYGFMFVKVLQYGTGAPLTGAAVTLRSGSTVMRAVTAEGQDGFVGFSNVPVGSTLISVEYDGAVSFPNSSYYDKNGEVLISGSGYEGCQMNIPYVVELKLGSLGSIGFYEETRTWNNGEWRSTRDKITENVQLTSRFTPNTSKSGGNARAVTYTSNMMTTLGTQELMTGSSFLMYGHYNLLVSGYGYRSHSEAIEAKVFGIDNYAGTYSAMTSAYEYPIVMKLPSGQGSVSGTVEWEKRQQPLEGTPVGLTGTWATTESSSVQTRVKLTNASNGRVYYSAYFGTTSDGKYSYSISGLPDGVYSFDIVSPYDFGKLENFPAQIIIDGTKLIVSGKVEQVDPGNDGAVRGYIRYNYLGNYDPIQGATVTLTRYGSISSAGSLSSNQNGYFNKAGLLKGFYQISVKAPTILGGLTYQYRLFVDGTEDLIIYLPISAFRVSGNVYPYTADGDYMEKRGTLFDLSLGFTRINSSGSASYSTQYAALSTAGINATYTINLVPGYYRTTLDSICYLKYVSGKLTISAATSKSFDLYVDDSGLDKHDEVVDCCNAGYHWKECTNCGHIFDKEAHSPSPWTWYSNSSCYRYCTICNYQVDSPSAHTMTSYIVKAATCTASGTRNYYCSRGCGHSYSETIPALGHAANGIWIFDNNATASYGGTHHQNCSRCGTTLNGGSGCSRGGWISNGISNHYDVCSVCQGKRYVNHSWTETSRTGYACTGGMVYYKCYTCGATKTGDWAPTEDHNSRGKCNVWHPCTSNWYCTGPDATHQWNGYYHILCSICGRQTDNSKWCAMHCGNWQTVKPCPN